MLPSLSPAKRPLWTTLHVYTLISSSSMVFMMTLFAPLIPSECTFRSCYTELTARECPTSSRQTSKHYEEISNLSFWFLSASHNWDQSGNSHSIWIFWSFRHEKQYIRMKTSTQRSCSRFQTQRISILAKVHYKALTESPYTHYTHTHFTRISCFSSLGSFLSVPARGGRIYIDQTVRKLCLTVS